MALRMKNSFSAIMAAANSAKRAKSPLPARKGTSNASRAARWIQKFSSCAQRCSTAFVAGSRSTRAPATWGARLSTWSQVWQRRNRLSTTARSAVSRRSAYSSSSTMPRVRSSWSGVCHRASTRSSRSVWSRSRWLRLKVRAVDRMNGTVTPKKFSLLFRYALAPAARSGVPAAAKAACSGVPTAASCPRPAVAPLKLGRWQRPAGSAGYGQVRPLSPGRDRGRRGGLRHPDRPFSHARWPAVPGRCRQGRPGRFP